MKLIFEPSVPVKVEKMKQRVRWMHPTIKNRGIDQTSLVLDDANSESPEFSFMVIGDTGTKSDRRHHPQRQVAQMMLAHGDNCRFVLHTGDVIYVVGSREYYPANFIDPYREFLVGGDRPQDIDYDQMLFKLPILPVLGNHDYYHVPLLYRLFAGVTLPLRKRLNYRDSEIGWYSSDQGDTFARAFLDYLAEVSPEKLAAYLDEHYVGKSDDRRCLRYQPSKFTRLPNRYYSFRYGGIDFFALDSNTFNVPSPLGSGKWVKDFDQDEFLQTCNLDFEQLDWLRTRLIASWQNSQVRGRVMFFHHPPYVTEVTKCYLRETLAVRHHLRWVLESVAKTLGDLTKGRSLVDLIFNGHAHCLEYLRTVDTGYADSHINYIISGGSGHALRYQWREGREIRENFPDFHSSSSRQVAESMLYVGRTDEGQDNLPYSCVRIDVQSGSPVKFKVIPLVTEQVDGKWCDRQLEAFVI